MIKATRRKPPARGVPPRDDLDRMQQLTHWPRWPWLPMKKRRSDGGMPEFGCLHADHVIEKNEKPRLYHVNLYQTGWLPDPAAQFTEFDSLEAILAAGWVID